MASFTKEFLTGSVNGCGITVTSGTDGTVGTAGTIHQCSAGTAGKEEIWLWAYNSHTSDVVLSVEWGTSALVRKMTIPTQGGLVPVIPGLPMNNAMKVQAYAGSAGVVVIDGFINRIVD